MTIVTPSRNISWLLAGTVLLLGCFVYSSCAAPFRTMYGDEAGNEADHFPAIVLIPQNGSHNYVFDWDQAVNSPPFSQFKPKAKYWRLHVFNFSDGQRIGGNGIEWKEFKTNRTETLSNLPFKELIRADVDTAEDETGEKDARTLSFLVVLIDQ